MCGSENLRLQCLWSGLIRSLKLQVEQKLDDEMGTLHRSRLGAPPCVRETSLKATSSPDVMGTSFLPDLSARFHSTISNLLNTSGNKQSLQTGESIRKAFLVGEAKLVATEFLVTKMLVYTVLKPFKLVECGISDSGNFMVVEGEVCIRVLAEEL